MSSDGPYREAAPSDEHGRRLVPLDRVASARQATLMRDAATDLASKLSKHASEIAVRARELAWDWVIMPNEVIPVSIGSLHVAQAAELAAQLDDIRRRLMVVTTRVSALASGAEEIMLELPPKAKVLT